MVQLFSYIMEGEKTYPYACIAYNYKYCIPYNDDTKHLVGTTEEAPEFYRYWEDWVMIIGAIIVGVLIVALVALGVYIEERCGGGFEAGSVIGEDITILIVIEAYLISMITEKPTPSALDVYRGNTELEITSVNGTPIDTVVVFKKN